MTQPKIYPTREAVDKDIKRLDRHPIETHYHHWRIVPNGYQLIREITSDEGNRKVLVKLTNGKYRQINIQPKEQQQ